MFLREFTKKGYTGRDGGDNTCASSALSQHQEITSINFTVAV